MQVADLLRERLQSETNPDGLKAAGERIQAADLICLFYRERGFVPAWSDARGLLPQVRDLLAAIERAELEGLQPQDYHLKTLRRLLRFMQRGRPVSDYSWQPRLAALDMLLSDAFLVYASHLAAGKVNAETGRPQWPALPAEVDCLQVLRNALIRNRIGESLKELAPRHALYTGLQQTLEQYRRIGRQGGWEKIPSGPTLQKGDQGKRVRALRLRLHLSGDLPAAEPADHRTDLFDESLEQALRCFQQRHGLEVTGQMDPATLAALNVPFEKRSAQIRVNLERWRWLPHDLGERYVHVNVASFDLTVYEHDLPVLRMKVVVGNQAWKTPVFSSEMNQVIINPYWTITPRVFLKETINYIRSDPNYLSLNHMRLLQGWEEDETELNPKDIDWSQVNEKTLNFRLRQDPGPWNILGRLKFNFPNKYQVYLHDTPYQEDFAKTVRMFSHGCIRIEKPLDFAVYLLRDKPGWTRERVLKEIDKNVEEIINLRRPIPVRVIYCTAWREEGGLSHFREDIYECDPLLVKALSASPPN